MRRRSWLGGSREQPTRSCQTCCRWASSTTLSDCTGPPAPHSVTVLDSCISAILLSRTTTLCLQCKRSLGLTLLVMLVSSGSGHMWMLHMLRVCGLTVSACPLWCAQEAALTRVSKMRDVFNRHFSLDNEGTPRTWRPQENIPALARAARREAARVLALLVGVRAGNARLFCSRPCWFQLCPAPPNDT